MIGLSPRVRGNRARTASRRYGPGSIPACAGEPVSPPPQDDSTKVYPRVCGGTSSRCSIRPPTRGLSPRVRGNLDTWAHHGDRRRSIPACAGEPRPSPRRSKTSGVYPRVCGGTDDIWTANYPLWGLSPRVRGNPPTQQVDRYDAGSIPACAGEPSGVNPNHAANAVYPRVCGGTDDLAGKTPEEKGLSPRVRGNPSRLLGISTDAGSIPACAGEPRSRRY